MTAQTAGAPGTSPVFQSVEIHNATTSRKWAELAQDAVKDAHDWKLIAQQNTAKLDECRAAKAELLAALVGALEVADAATYSGHRQQRIDAARAAIAKHSSAGGA